MEKLLIFVIIYTVGCGVVGVLGQRSAVLRPDLVLPPPLDINAGKPGVCEDSKLAKSCRTWKQIGYCRKNSRFYEYMQVYCKKTCKLCDDQVPCEDDPNYEWMCPTWKKSGSCNTKSSTGVFAAHIRLYCKKTCGFCKGHLQRTCKLKKDGVSESGRFWQSEWRLVEQA